MRILLHFGESRFQHDMKRLDTDFLQSITRFELLAWLSPFVSLAPLR